MGFERESPGSWFHYIGVEPKETIITCTDLPRGRNGGRFTVPCMTRHKDKASDMREHRLSDDEQSSFRLIPVRRVYGSDVPL